MKNSAARKLKQVPEGYLMVGVDPHKKKHAAVAMTQDFMVQSKLKFANSRHGFEEALERARLEMIRTGCRGVMVAIETASHYWRNFAYFLDERGIPFRLINQFMSVHQFETVPTSGQRREEPRYNPASFNGLWLATKFAGKRNFPLVSIQSFVRGHINLDIDFRFTLSLQKFFNCVQVWL